jgi:hypothetical protein
MTLKMDFSHSMTSFQYIGNGNPKLYHEKVN